PPPPPPPALAADVKAYGLAPDGSEYPVATIRVEEFISSEMRPLLHYVFFDEGKDVIPDRYDRLSPAQAAGFSYLQLKPRDILSTYHHVLNIVGYRLTQYPDATLRIVGTNSDEGIEAGDTALSRRRADAVRDYLVRAWGINERRITVEARNLPEKPSNIGEIDGIQENRRVELYTSVPEVLDPIVIDDTLRTVNPPRVRFRPEVTSDAGITEWSLDVTQDRQTLRHFDGKLDVPTSLDWNVEKERASIPRSDTDLRYRLTVTDAAAQTVTTEPGTLPVEQLTVQRKRSERLGDKEIDRYNLILFDFNSPLLGPRNERIADMIRPRIAPSATVTIAGYTDRIGETPVNQTLSEARAQTAAKALGVAPERATGLGETNMYTNDLPEGRFYCRTVTILVETPVE
ncbi:MAG: OmpA family protein, partial [Bacteroidetes bacterium]|nr:OmpA family protein [Bacteroidota bacterium]